MNGQHTITSVKSVWVLIALICILPFPVFAATHRTAGRVILIEAVNGAQLRDLKLLLQENGLKLPVETSAESGLIRSLRQQGNSRQGNDSQKLSCVPDARSIPQLLSEAQDALEFLDDTRADELLSRADDTYPCSSEVIDAATLTHWMTLRARLQELRGLNPTPFLERVLQIEPRFEFASEASEVLKQGLDSARSSLRERSTMPVMLSPLLVADRLLLLNGVPASSTHLSLPVGRYYLQRVDGSGRPIGARLMEVTADEGAINNWPPEGMHPPSEGEVQLELTAATHQPANHRAVAKNARLWLATESAPWVLLVAPSAEHSHVDLVRIWADGMMEAGGDITLPTKKLRPTRVLTGVLTLGSLVAGALLTRDVYNFIQPGILSDNNRYSQTLAQMQRDARITQGISGAAVVSLITDLWVGERQARPATQFTRILRPVSQENEF